MSDIQSIVSGERAYPLKSKQVKKIPIQENNNVLGRSIKLCLDVLSSLKIGLREEEKSLK